MPCSVFQKGTQSRRRTFFVMGKDPTPDPAYQRGIQVNPSSVVRVSPGVVTLPRQDKPSPSPPQDEENKPEDAAEGQAKLNATKTADNTTTTAGTTTTTSTTKANDQVKVQPKKRFTARKMEPAVVLEVEIDGEIQSLTFFRGSNSTKVAQDFCESHDMGDEDCIMAVVDLIKSNTGMGMGATHVVT